MKEGMHWQRRRDLHPHLRIFRRSALSYTPACRPRRRQADAGENGKQPRAFSRSPAW